MNSVRGGSVDGNPIVEKPLYMIAYGLKLPLLSPAHGMVVFNSSMIFYVNLWQGRIEGCKKTILSYIVADKAARGSSAFLSLDVHAGIV